MPKLKTNRSAAKRFKFTKKGRLKKRNAQRGHHLSHKSSKRKRRLRQDGYVSKVDEQRIKMLLPYLR